MNRDAMLQGVYDSELRRMTGGVAVIWQFTLLAQVLIYLPAYRQPLVPLAVWLGMLAAAAWLVPRCRAGGLSRPDSAVAMAVAVTAVLLVGLQRRVAGTVDWSVLGVGWLLALVAVSRPAWEWICGAMAVATVHAVVAARVLGLQALGLARLASTAYALVIILVAFAAVRPMFRTTMRIAARRAELARQSAAQRAAADAVRADRLRRLGVMEAEVLPLLRGIADGRLDPGSDAIWQQCRERAAILRGALLDRAETGGGLLAGLEPVLRRAARRGVPVEVRALGDPGRASPEVIRQTAAAVERVLCRLPPQQATLTVLASAAEVELYLVFRVPEPAVWQAAQPLGSPGAGAGEAADPPPGQSAHRCRGVAEVDDSGAGCLEMRWAREFAG